MITKFDVRYASYPEDSKRCDTQELCHHISEPILENGAKGLAPFLMCYTELLQLEKEN